MKSKNKMEIILVEGLPDLQEALEETLVQREDCREEEVKRRKEFVFSKKISKLRIVPKGEKCTVTSCSTLWHFTILSIY